MGFSKCAEDNYEALCENLTAKGDDYNYTAWCCAPVAQTNSANKTKHHDADNFADMFKEESCFSYLR